MKQSANSVDKLMLSLDSMCETPMRERIRGVILAGVGVTVLAVGIVFITDSLGRCA